MALALQDGNSIRLKRSKEGAPLFEVTDRLGQVREIANIILADGEGFKLAARLREENRSHISILTHAGRDWVVFAPTGLRGGGWSLNSDNEGYWLGSVFMIVGGVVLTITSGGAAAPLIAGSVAMGAGTSGGIYTGTTDDKDLNAKDFAKEVAIGSATGAVTGGMGAGTSSVVSKVGLEGAKKFGAVVVGGALSGASGSATSRVTRNAANGDELAKDLTVKEVMTGAAAGGMGAAAGEAVKKVAGGAIERLIAGAEQNFDEVATEAQKIAAGAFQGGVGGAAGGAAGGYTAVHVKDKLVDEDERKSKEQLDKDAGNAALQGALMGGAFGTVFGAAEAAERHKKYQEAKAKQAQEQKAAGQDGPDEREAASSSTTSKSQGSDQQVAREGLVSDLKQAQQAKQELVREFAGSKEGQKAAAKWDAGYRPKDKTIDTLDKLMENGAMGEHVNLHKGSKHHTMRGPKESGYWKAQASIENAENQLRVFDLGGPLSVPAQMFADSAAGRSAKYYWDAGYRPMEGSGITTFDQLMEAAAAGRHVRLRNWRQTSEHIVRPPQPSSSSRAPQASRETFVEELRWAKEAKDELIRRYTDSWRGKEALSRWNQGFRPKDKTIDTFEKLAEQAAMGEHINLHLKGKKPYPIRAGDSEAYWKATAQVENAQKRLDAFEVSQGKGLLSDGQMSSVFDRMSATRERGERIVRSMDKRYGAKIEELLRKGYYLTDQRHNSRKAAVEQLAYGEKLCFHHKSKGNEHIRSPLNGREYHRIQHDLQADQQLLNQHESARAAMAPAAASSSSPPRLAGLDRLEAQLNGRQSALRQWVDKSYRAMVENLQRTGYWLKDNTINGDVDAILDRIAQGDKLKFHPPLRSESKKQRTIFSEKAKDETSSIRAGRADLAKGRGEYEADQGLSQQARYNVITRQQAGIVRCQEKLDEAIDSAVERAWEAQKSDSCKDRNLNGNREAIRTALARDGAVAFETGDEVRVWSFGSLRSTLESAKATLARTIGNYELDFGPLSG